MLRIKKGSPDCTHKWISKEYGSWEDHNYSESHVCGILQREMKQKSAYMNLTIEEAKELLQSAEYQASAGWDGWDDPKEGILFEKSMMSYAFKLNKAISNAL